MTNEACLYVREREANKFLCNPLFVVSDYKNRKQQQQKPRCLKAGGKEQLRGLTALSLETTSF